MIPINKQTTKKIAFYLSGTDEKGSYPVRRAKTIAKALPTAIEIVFIAPKKLQTKLTNFPFIQAENSRELIAALKTYQPHLLVRDSGSTSKEEVANLKKIVPSMIHFDDFGGGGELASFVIQTLYTEIKEKPLSHYLVGPETFIADAQIAPFKEIGLEKKDTNPLPHLVVTFGDEDSNNLTYRALRHLLQLQIPLKITIIIGENYKHDLIDLRMMALSRKNTSIQQQDENTMKLLSTADIVLCSSGYLPYEISVMGIPCIVLAKNEFESTLEFPTDKHGFIHLGLGRKVKQSLLLNAVMEFLLHDSLRRKTIKRQTQLNLGDGKNMICEAILYCLEYPGSKLSLNETGKETPNMI